MLEIYRNRDRCYAALAAAMSIIYFTIIWPVAIILNKILA